MPYFGIAAADGVQHQENAQIRRMENPEKV